MSIRLSKLALGLAPLFALLAVPPGAQAKSSPRSSTHSSIQLKASGRTVAKEKARPTAMTNVHARPALWVVKDKDTTIYLFGTIHLLRPGIEWLEGARKTAFDSAKELVLEIGDEPDAATQIRIAQLGLDLNGPPLAEKLPEDIRPKYKQLLADYSAPAAVIDRMKPWLAAVTITSLPLAKLGYDRANGVETQLRKAAQAQGKSISGLESAEEQIGFFNGLSDKLQMALLVDTINEQATIEQSLSRMIDAWVAGDPVLLADELNKSMDDDKDLKQLLLIDRNQRWADWIKARLQKPGVVFLAVGAGHLAGSGSVQEALKQRRIKTALVPDR